MATGYGTFTLKCECGRSISGAMKEMTYTPNTALDSKNSTIDQAQQAGPQASTVPSMAQKGGDKTMETGSQTGYAVSGVSPFDWRNGFSPAEAALVSSGGIGLHFVRDSVERRQDAAELRSLLMTQNAAVAASLEAIKLAIATEAAARRNEQAQATQIELLLLKSQQPTNGNGGAA